MIEIANLEEWTKEYFSDPENQKKAEKACERYDRLMVKNIKRQLSGGAEKIFLNEEPADDPGKCMEKAKYEVIPFAKVDGKNCVYIGKYNGTIYYSTDGVIAIKLDDTQKLTMMYQEYHLVSIKKRERGEHLCSLLIQRIMQSGLSVIWQ